MASNFYQSVQVSIGCADTTNLIAQLSSRVNFSLTNFKIIIVCLLLCCIYIRMFCYNNEADVKLHIHALCVDNAAFIICLYCVCCHALLQL